MPASASTSNASTSGAASTPSSAPRVSAVETDAVSRYLAELEGHSLLSREAELEAAEAVVEGELALWRALLSHEPALETLARVLEAELEEALVDDVQAEVSLLPRPCATATVAHDLPEQLRLRDVRKQALREAFRAAEAWAREATATAGERRALDEYLRRVRRARREYANAKQRFAAANLRLVVMVARRHQRRGLPLADLIQEGNLGLMVAVERFDPERGFRFSTYAVWWIRHGIRRAIVNKGNVVRIPVHRVDALRLLNREIQEALARTGHAPSSEELAEATGFSRAKVEELRQMSTARATSLDRGIGDPDGQTFLDCLVDESGPLPDAAVWQGDRRREVQKALADLRPIEVSILTARFGLDGTEAMTLRSLGERYQLSRERIRQIQQAALARLRRLVDEGHVDAIRCAG